MELSLIIPAFIAGVLTFLAPCTLPLVPGYLGFISGVSTQDLQDLSKYRLWLSRVGGVFVIFFGLFMLRVLKLPFLNVEKHIGRVKALKPGNPASSLIFGATFAFSWTPCVGPSWAQYSRSPRLPQQSVTELFIIFSTVLQNYKFYSGAGERN